MYWVVVGITACAFFASLIVVYWRFAKKKAPAELSVKKSCCDSKPANQRCSKPGSCGCRGEHDHFFTSNLIDSGTALMETALEDEPMERFEGGGGNFGGGGASGGWDNDDSSSSSSDDSGDSSDD